MILAYGKEGMRMREYWYKCPKCGFPRMLKIRPDTRVYNFPGYCKKCKQESIINIDNRAKSRIVNSD